MKENTQGLPLDFWLWLLSRQQCHLLHQCTFTQKEKLGNEEILRNCIIYAFVVVVQSLSDSFTTPWTVTHQAPLSMEFPRQEYWNDCHFLLQGIFPTQGSKSRLLNWQVDSLSQNHLGSPIVLSSGNLELISVFRDLQSILQITWKYILTVLEEKDCMSIYLEIVFTLKKN